MRARFRVVLPIVFGTISLALMLSDWYLYSTNLSDVYEPWPFAAPFAFLQAINAPALVLAAPFYRLFQLEVVNDRYPTLLCVILFWWSWFGARLDFGLLARPDYRRPKLLAGMLFGLASAMAFIGTASLWGGISASYLFFAVTGAIMGLSSLALAYACVVAALRLWRRDFPRTSYSSRRLIAAGLFSTTLISLTSYALFVDSQPQHDPDSCVTSENTGCIHGTIVGEDSKPIKGVIVEIFPEGKASEPIYMVGKSDWTDEQGRYSADWLMPGRYLVAVHNTDAPVDRRPFATVYFPGVDQEKEARAIEVMASSTIRLQPLKVRRLPLATIQIEVMWPNGSRPERSNLLFHNIKFPHQAMIGNESPQIDNGLGEFAAPEGFDYKASASVQCDAGTVIRSRSSAVQHLHVGGKTTPSKLIFVLEGPPCPLWRPH